MKETDGSLWAVHPIQGSSEELLGLLGGKEMYRIPLQHITAEHRKREWLSVRILLKELLQEEKEIAYTSSGRPYLTDHSYHISISHTKGYVAIILDKYYPVGIDIEQISPRIHKIRKRFVNEEEESYLSKEKETVHLLIYWSAKESIFKALEEEWVDFQTQLHIGAFSPVLGELSSFSADETKTNQHYSFQVHYLAQSDYVLTFTKKFQTKYCLEVCRPTPDRTGTWITHFSASPLLNNPSSQQTILTVKGGGLSGCDGFQRL